jgi:hypothetical protein
MFLDNSRYARMETTKVKTESGSTVVALKLRRLPPVTGDPHTVESGERLDVIADSQYGDATRFWHIADANSELDSRTLTDTVGESILVPRT